ncbi:MAG: translation initiation factor [Bdellovibrionia bacterium]
MKKIDCKCIIEEAVQISQIHAVFRLEKNGRGGKTVTVLDQLPKNTEFLKNLTKEFKAKCGSGGTFEITDKCGVIEIQGDKREVMKKILQNKEIKFKGM